MPFPVPSLDQMWADLLLILGFALTGGSLMALALCALGGCLDLVERWRDSRVRSGQTLDNGVASSRPAKAELRVVSSSERSYEWEETSHHRRWRPGRSNSSYSSSSSRI